MKNIFLYYYNLEVNNIFQKENMYFFSYNLEKYCFIKYKRDIKEIDFLYQISEELINRGLLVHRMIINKDNKLLTQYNDSLYVLLKLYITDNKKIEYSDIKYFLDNTILIKDNNLLNKSNWGALWETKNDYLEYQISEMGLDYPILSESFSYYIGIGENAISYFNNTLKQYSKLSINHKKNHTLFDLYNPLEFVIDLRSRDIAEYIKYIFYTNYDELWENINIIFSESFNNYEVSLIYSRLLYPTYYFNLYDKIINKKVNENSIIKVTQFTEKYEEFLSDLYHYLIDLYKLDNIYWITKK